VGSTLGQILPLALGVGINPLPIIAMILILLTPRAKASGLTFLAGWLLGLTAVGGVAIAIANRTDLYASEGSTLARWLRIIVGIAVLALAAKQWLGRPRAGEDTKKPRWMAAIETFTPARSFRLGLILSGANPKNVALTLAAAGIIVAEGLTVTEEVTLLAAFILVATAGVATPLVVFLVSGSAATRVLEAWGAWLQRNNAVIMSIVLLVIGLLLLVKGFTG
jgi:threonine/homoserine/homoserine lactone efflux protein